jgi:hypothetical protein
VKKIIFKKKEKRKDGGIKKQNKKENTISLHLIAFLDTGSYLSLDFWIWAKMQIHILSKNIL